MVQDLVFEQLAAAGVDIEAVRTVLMIVANVMETAQNEPAQISVGSEALDLARACIAQTLVIGVDAAGRQIEGRGRRKGHCSAGAWTRWTWTGLYLIPQIVSEDSRDKFVSRDEKCQRRAGCHAPSSASRASCWGTWRDDHVCCLSPLPATAAPAPAAAPRPAAAAMAPLGLS